MSVPSKVYRVDEKLDFNTTEPDVTGDTYTASIGEDYDLTPGLVAHYLLNNNADDCVGTFDGVSTDVDFKGDVANFNGTSSKTELDVDALTGNSGMISAWLKGSGQIASKSQHDNVDHLCYLSLTAESKFKFFIKTTGVRNSLLSTAQVSSDLIHFVMLSNGSNYKMYFNGVEISFTVDEGVDDGKWFGDLSSINTANIGALVWSSSDSFFDGDMSNVRIYSDAKDQAFINELYAEGYYPKPLPLPTTDGPVAHYPLTGTAEDATGNYDGTEYSYNYVDNSEFGSVSNFSNNYFVADIDSIPDDFTINFWTASAEDSATASLTLGMVATNAEQKGIMFYRMERFYGGDNTGTWSIITDPFTQYLGTQLHMYTLTKNGLNFDIFIDGELVDSVVANNAIIYANTLLYVGRGWDSGFYDATFKDVRIYNKALTQQEITDIYNYEKNFRSIDIDNGLIAYYPLKNNSKDNYYNEYDGTDTDVTYDGESASFNGSTSAIDTIVNPKSSELSFSIWIYTNDTVINTIWQKETDGSSDDLAGIDLWNESLRWSNEHEDNSYSQIIYDFSSYIGYLTHIVYSITATEGKLYVNNDLKETVVDSALLNETAFMNNETFRFGRNYSNNNDRTFTGYMSLARIYNKAITPEQIKIIYDTENLDEHIVEDPLLSTRTFKDVSITGRSIETKAIMSATGNKCTEISGDIYKEL